MSILMNQIVLNATRMAEQPFTPVEVPAKTMRLRFKDSNYDPRTALPSEPGVWYSGTWTKVNGTSYNDWDWYKSNNNWSYGFYASSSYALRTDAHLVDIEFDIIGINTTGVTNMDYLFQSCNKLKHIYGTLDMSNVSSSYAAFPLIQNCQSLETLPNIIISNYSTIPYFFAIVNIKNINVFEGYKFDDTYHSGFSMQIFGGRYDGQLYGIGFYGGCSRSAICYRILNKNSNVTHFNILKYYIDHNTSVSSNFSGFNLALSFTNIHGYAKDYIQKTALVSGTNKDMIGAFKGSTIEYAYTADDFPDYAKAGSWDQTFAGCYNLKNFTECANIVNSYASTKTAFYLAGMNSSSGRAELAALSTTLGGGVKQEFRNAYLEVNIFNIPGMVTMTKTYGVTFFWPKSMRATDASRLYNFHNPQQSTTYNRNMFYGHGAYENMQPTDTTKSLNIYLALIQFDDTTGNIVWDLHTPKVATIATRSSTVSGSRRYSNIALSNMLSGSSANNFDPNKVVLETYLAVYNGESNPNKDFFIMNGAYSSYTWTNTSYKMLELQDITVGTYLDD